jgi:anti-anti-sigma factor
MISSRTPEGWPGRCAVCNRNLNIEPSTFPTRDATCPHCGSLVWFGELITIRLSDPNLDGLLEDWEVAGSPKGLLLDCSELDSLSSQALGRLIILHRKVQLTGGHLSLTGLGPAITEMFRITGLDRLF